MKVGPQDMARILIAEDNDNMRDFLARALRRAGHMVAVVEDGLAAAAVLESHDFDLLLADVVMPGLDGVELAKRVARAQPEIRIVFITGFAAVSLGRERKPEGQPGAKPVPALSKPFHLNQLVSQVDQLLCA
mgnify:CR=1 FL=1